jgi:hypothetical protein
MASSENVGGEKPGEKRSTGDWMKRKSSTHLKIEPYPSMWYRCAMASPHRPKIPFELAAPNGTRWSTQKFSSHWTMMWGWSSGWTGIWQYAASMSNVAALEPGDARETALATSAKNPQVHAKSSRLIWELREVLSGESRGYEKSCTTLKTPGLDALSTMPRGAVLKGPIRDSNISRVKGPV